jgi:hypothetical protein
MHDIDVHILHLPTDNKKWLKQCLNSIQKEPINRIDIPGIVGDYWSARYQGYHTGVAKYVSFVDPDDYVLPGAFAACQAELDADKDKKLIGVYTRSRRLYENLPEVTALVMTPYSAWSRELMEKKFCVHQVVVMRREFVIPCINSYMNIGLSNSVLVKMGGISRTDQMFFKLLTLFGDFKSLSIEGYIWREHKNQNHNSPTTLKTRAQTPEQEIYTAKVVHNILINKKVSSD